MEKEQAYRQILEQLGPLLEGEADPISRMSTICAVLIDRLPSVSWVGFYRVAGERALAVGPYQGPLGCLRIAFDQGVCGAAARTGRAQIVADVHRFPGHIACDSDARSEIVVPVRDRSGTLTAVLDLDSHRPGAFDETDRIHLEQIAACVAAPPHD